MEFLRSLLGLERKERALEQAGAPVLTLHIGLPKTASTFLQRSVFSSAPGLTYVRKYKELPLPVAIEKMQRVHPRRVSDFVDSIGEELPEGNVLVSNENVSMHVKEPWADKGPTPTRFCERVVALEPLVGTLRVILGIRRQDQWLASR